MPRVNLDLENPAHLQQLNGVWRFAPGLVPGEPNEGLVSRLVSTPARLKDYDDSGWEICEDLNEWHSRGFTFVWYRIKITLPEQVGGRDVTGCRCIFETNVDDYGEIWVDGECNRERGTIRGFNVQQRVVVNPEPHAGDQHTIAVLGINGPLAAPSGAVFVRYATLAFEWVIPGFPWPTP